MSFPENRRAVGRNASADEYGTHLALTVVIDGTYRVHLHAAPEGWLALTCRLCALPEEGPARDALAREAGRLAAGMLSRHAAGCVVDPQGRALWLQQTLRPDSSDLALDEAFGALDPLTRDEVTRAYRTIHDRLGLTTVIVTHDVQEALLLADRIIVLARGRIVADGTPADLAARREPTEVSQLFDMPRRQAMQIQALLGAGIGPAHE